MRLLSKSQFTRGVQCHKSLWLYRHQPDLRAPVTPEQQAVFDSGTKVGVLARTLFPDGILIEADHLHPQVAIDETERAIAERATTLYEAAILHDNVIVRIDILTRDASGWHIYEVKSSTEVKDVHLDDVAIQRYVLAGFGGTVSSAHVIVLDNSYVRQGKIDVQKLFKIVEVTDETNPLVAEVPGRLAAMKAMDASSTAPCINIGPHCTKPYDCDFQAHCWKEVPDYSVFNLAGARMDKKTTLWRSGIRLVEEIPAGTKLTPYQETQRMVAKSGQAYIDHAAIKAHLAQLVYPAYHLDFETSAPAIPPFDGLRPYQATPFQAVINVQATQGAASERYDFLEDGRIDPRPGIIAFLRKNIGPTGSLIAWSKSFEGGVMEKLGLGEYVPRLWDIMTPFQKAHWAEAGFHGSYSIKAVLPILVPEMKYEGLEIADGVAAMRAYEQLMRRDLPENERARLINALKIYCGQDVFGMVKVLERLYTVVA